MQDLNDLYFFAQVVDHKGFAPASRVLGVPKSTLSRRIATLERHLGVRLVQRSTRQFSVTEIGQHYYNHCKAMLVEAEAAQDVIEQMRAEPQGVVRLTSPVAMLHARIGAMLGEFMARNPRVTVHLEATNRVVDVVGEGIDIAIRVRPPPLKDSDLVMRVLGERTWCLVASPALVRQHAIAAPAELTEWPSLDFGPPQPQHVWHLEGLGDARATVRHTPRFVTDDMIALRQAAVAGAGIVQLPTMMVSDELRRGELIRILPDWLPKSGIVHAVFPSRRGLLPSVRALLDFLVDEFARIEES
ncbi:LysR family transcriptional regulator [Burkholderia sp. Bp9017]|uniref:LysR family transcriptional regulator n=1 Tax=Burkholderia anthina TaxID=179879 RepID=A0A7T6VM38_9BURK|nr:MULTISPECIES: LysR family transcriptional regulator [Burkholderia]MBY4869510.1 LysR family transcriptional regulator [Burkholderia anthina]QQK06458.1 LysR family transcriptional regulator [Burkholderia anthina]RQZ30310.1 LysR family transcriptional regulator [Burkholderia sp. Bp9017]RQZ36444.1 LysR family transcriptional regulator [Burkholderia sp. Bp9016]